MAKVKQVSTTPKTRGRPQKKVDEDVSTSVASTTSDTQPQKRARSNATKKSASNAQNTRVNDSSVSELSMPASSASQSGKRQNDKGASLSKVSMKSKKSMTKTKPKPAKKTMKKASEISWLKALLTKEKPHHPHVHRTSSGVEVRLPTLLRLRSQDEVNYVQFPQVNGKVSGYVQMKSGTEKKPRKACVRMKFIVLIGNISVVAGEKVTEYSCGTIFHIPKGLKYGMQNTNRETCYMRFQTVTAEKPADDQ